MKIAPKIIIFANIQLLLFKNPNYYAKKKDYSS